MKTKYTLLICLLLLIASCNKDDDPKNPIDQLPPATQTGAQTFGYLIDGEAFIPDKFGAGLLRAFYQIVEGKYFLGIHASRNDSPLEGMSLFADDIQIEEGMTYTLKNEDGDNSAFYAEYSLGGGLTAKFITTANVTGTIFISKFDPSNFIISGTFSFKAKEINTGEIVNVTNGRFDVRYTN